MFLRTVVARCVKSAGFYSGVGRNVIAVCKPGSFRLKHGIGNITRVKPSYNAPEISYHRAIIFKHGDMNFHTYDNLGIIVLESEYTNKVQMLASHYKMLYEKLVAPDKYLSDLSLITAICNYSKYHEFLECDIFTEVPFEPQPNLLNKIGIRNIYPLYVPGCAP